MLKWSFGFLAAALCGALFAWAVPRFAAIGLLIAGFSSVLLLQVALLAIAMPLTKPKIVHCEAPMESPQSELLRILVVYSDLKYFLGKLTGILALVYGIIMHSWYFAVLGAAATLLFWVLDRLHEAWLDDLKGAVETPFGGRDGDL